MREELKSTLKYLKNKNNTRRIKAITITEAQKVVEEIERLNNIINELENYIRARADDNNTCSICSVMIDDLLNILKGEDKE